MTLHVTVLRCHGSHTAHCMSCRPHKTSEGSSHRRAHVSREHISGLGAFFATIINTRTRGDSILHMTLARGHTQHDKCNGRPPRRSNKRRQPFLTRTNENNTIKTTNIVAYHGNTNPCCSDENLEHQWMESWLSGCRVVW